MIRFQPQHSTSDFHSRSSERWISICNTVLLLLVTFFCGMVLYEIRSLDQTLISVLDSSRIDIDLMSVDLIESHSQPIWRNISDELNAYSAFHDPKENHILIIGSSIHSEILLEDIRCLVEYEDGHMSLVDVDQKKVSECSIVFIYCFLKMNQLPRKVSLVSVGNVLPKQWINVDIIPDLEPSKLAKKVACVSLVTENISPESITNFVKFNEMADIKEFYIYYHSISREVLDVILKLTADGHFLHILRWNKKESSSASERCPMELSELIQDCSHRSLGKYEYINVFQINDSPRDSTENTKIMVTKNLTDIATY